MSEQALADGEQRAAWVVAFDVLGKRVEDECLGPLDASQVARCMRPLIQEHAAEVEQALVVELEGVVDVVRLAQCGVAIQRGMQGCACCKACQPVLPSVSSGLKRAL